jgi:hypothetical protein
VVKLTSPGGSSYRRVTSRGGISPMQKYPIDPRRRVQPVPFLLQLSSAYAVFLFRHLLQKVKLQEANIISTIRQQEKCGCLSLSLDKELCYRRPSLVQQDLHAHFARCFPRVASVAPHGRADCVDKLRSTSPFPFIWHIALLLRSRITLAGAAPLCHVVAHRRLSTSS